MTVALAGIAIFSPGSLAWNVSLSAMGFASGFYVVPLNAWLQDLAADEHRARVISALNLMTSLSGVIAVATGFLLDLCGISPSGQILVTVPGFLVMCILLPRFLRRTSS
jgi:MFS family permease